MAFRRYAANLPLAKPTGTGIKPSMQGKHEGLQLATGNISNVPVRSDGRSFPSNYTPPAQPTSKQEMLEANLTLLQTLEIAHMLTQGEQQSIAASFKFRATPRQLKQCIEAEYALRNNLLYLLGSHLSHEAKLDRHASLLFAQCAVRLIFGGKDVGELNAFIQFHELPNNNGWNFQKATTSIATQLAGREHELSAWIILRANGSKKPEEVSQFVQDAFAHFGISAQPMQTP